MSRMVKSLNIELRGIQKSYGKQVLREINLSITNGDYISIIGKSGSGKTTLSNILGLIEDFDAGKYTFNGMEIRNGRDYSKIRLTNIGFIFQSYNLIPTLTCEENILLPYLYSKERPKKEYREIIDELEIGPLLKRKVTTLSGGEKQRVATARALQLNPGLILADEPTGNLDPVNKETLIHILERENKKGRAILIITHDHQIAQNAARQIILSDGFLQPHA